MAKNLLIVESPAKSKTIEKYLGSDYQVEASFGHVRDLPKSTLGVDLENNFEPHYIVSPNSRKTISRLKKAISGKKVVYIATDLDREGEAIGWHIVQALGLESSQKKVKSSQLDVKRITFDEITKSALIEALKHPREINQDLVDAQQARRVLDRLVGYTLSPLLWKKLFKGLSAGRVQSVALRLITDREKERLAFKPQDYWTISALLAKKGRSQDRFIADLVSYQNKKLAPLEINSESQAVNFKKAIEKEKFIVLKLEKSEQKRYPKPPYTTSTLQQDAVNKLNFTAKKTMILAQKLYEAGLITYMRTDSVHLSNDSLKATRSYIEKEFGSKYLPTESNFYKTQSKGAQEAHEAIRPTNLTESGKIVRELESAQARLFDLIWKRTVASQMKPAVFKKTQADIVAGDYGFRATGSLIIFDGFLRIWGNEEKNNEIPELTKDEQLDLISLTTDKHTTEPPPRYTEARLIKTLEELGVGRPSTYAPTIETLFNRNYIELITKQLAPTDTGFKVSDLLVKHFPEIVDSEFTASMENDLDIIAQGEKKWQPVIKNFWQPFNQKVEEKGKTIEKINTDKPTDKKCHKCDRPMVEKIGRFGRFLACSGFPDCKNTEPIVESSNLICPRDGSSLVIKRTKKRKNFFGCALYPKCNFAIWKKKDMVKKIEELQKNKEKLEFEKEAIESVS